MDRQFLYILFVGLISVLRCTQEFFTYTDLTGIVFGGNLKVAGGNQQPSADLPTYI